MSGKMSPAAFLREQAETWDHIRDHETRAASPKACWDIEAAKRDFLAPSKAHIKRLKRRRLLVVPARAPAPADQSARLKFNRDEKRRRIILGIVNPYSIPKDRSSREGVEQAQMTWQEAADWRAINRKGNDQ